MESINPETWFTIIAVLQLGDVYTTLRALKRGAVEANPVIKRLMDAIGVKEALLLAKIVALVPLWVWVDRIPTEAWVAITALYGWVLWHNAGVIRRLKKKKSA